MWYMYTYFLILATSSPNGFSQQYIFITLIPEMISFMTFTLSSVWIAVLFLSMNVKSRCSVSFDHVTVKIDYTCNFNLI